MLNRTLRSLVATTSIALLTAGLAACSDAESVSNDESNITEPAAGAEQEHNNNCWLYAHASWAEAMHAAATSESFDISQSYWTYWFWFDQVTHGRVEGAFHDDLYTSERGAADATILLRGLMAADDFAPGEGTVSETSTRQDDAFWALFAELEDGRLATEEARRDGLLVRQVLDEIWGLSDEVRAQLDQAFGKDGSKTFSSGDANAEGTKIIRGADFAVKYTERDRNTDSPPTATEGNLVEAIASWTTISYVDATTPAEQREFLTRIQKALDDDQPVMLTWYVNRTAMVTDDPAQAGAFVGAEGGEVTGTYDEHRSHLAMLEGYQATTEEFGVIPADAKLDPSVAEDKAKLDAALLPSTTIDFLRIKRVWGTYNQDLNSEAGLPPHHDLYMSYLNGPVTWCPEADSDYNCYGETVPLRHVVLPPGY